MYVASGLAISTLPALELPEILSPCCAGIFRIDLDNLDEQGSILLHWLDAEGHFRPTLLSKCWLFQIGSEVHWCWYVLYLL